MTRSKVLIAFCGTFLLSAPAFAAAPDGARAGRTARASASIQAERAPAAGTQGEILRYRAREAASPNAKNYEGGDRVIVIGATTATIVLAVVLLVVLL
jgi:hypothetical protein